MARQEGEAVPPLLRIGSTVGYAALTIARRVIYVGRLCCMLDTQPYISSGAGAVSAVSACNAHTLAYMVLASHAAVNFQSRVFHPFASEAHQRSRASSSTLSVSSGTSIFRLLRHASDSSGSASGLPAGVISAGMAPV